MSFDFSCGPRSCDHLQILERMQIDFTDFRTLQFKANPQVNMRAPINGVSLLRLWYKGTLVKPSHPLYGFSISPDLDRIQMPTANYPFSKIVFNRPIREINPLVEISYVTLQPFCLKCGGTGRVADWSVAPSGSLNRVTGRRKLSQQTLKYVLTSRNPFNPNLTTPIKSYLNQKFGLTITDSDIASAITTALSTYQSIQRAQSTVQTMDAEEMIQNLASVSAVEDASDPTVINIAIEIEAYGSTEAIPLNFALQTS